MNGLTAWMERYILPVAAKIGSQKHLVALRDAFIGMMPVTMAGAIAVLLNAFMRDFPNTYLGEGNGITTFFTPVIAVNGLVWTGTLAIMAVVFAASLGCNVARAYDVDVLSGMLVSLAAFFIGLPQSATTTVTLAEKLPKNITQLFTDAGATVNTVDGVSAIEAGAWGYFPFGKYMGGTGLFTAMIFGFISVIIFAKLMKKNIIIKMPDSVPPAVSKAFAAIIPGVFALYVSAMIYHIFEKITGKLLIDWISESIQTPLIGLSQGYGAVFLIVLLVHVLWFFGLHGTNIMSPVLQSIYGVAMVDNTNAYQQGQEIPYKWVAGSFEAFVWPGGAGVTLVLIISILLLSKRADYKTVGKLGVGPGLFNINEPVMFGMPVVLNPIMLIPFILAPLATATIAYFATMAGLVNPVVVNVIWVMPTIISGFLATAGDWRAIVLTVVNLAVAFVIWAPFVLAANKMDPNLGEPEE
ncbi:PTS sugar transporter subunit IIC [Enterococcus sp. DIV0242_7C1]|uniref:Permease IIC component n=1 Tax=Candidatus Enterococcus dunnyi TaxID=1834192 RepID=A0A200J9L3_9ENTE|nr:MULTISPECIES: PTS sugar transporter subunit IIC [unclassified Enterococcus]MBO0470828.1 PTS sugar transporter subunit IIC [Enterococcus sp. DIV0242_7C1]OUZ33275.1 PTS system, cellobiose-specific IIC component [Enterococcus sp. 9D6_DIV0238]